MINLTMLLDKTYNDDINPAILQHNLLSISNKAFITTRL